MNTNDNLWTRAAWICGLLAALTLAAGPAMAAADLQITSLTVEGTPRVGTCNTVWMTVQNTGDAFTGDPTLDIALITYPAGTPNLNRATKDLFISPMQGGAQVSFPISGVEFKTSGSAVMQALVDSKQETTESNENNNVRTVNVSVSGTCDPPPPTTPLTRAGQGCDLELIFTAPSGSTIPYNSSTAFVLRAKNVGSGQCESTKLRLYRYNSSTASGYGSAVGGTRNIWVVPALAPGAAAESSNFSDNPKAKGTVTYAPKFLSAWNDGNNYNHQPKKTVKSQ